MKVLMIDKYYFIKGGAERYLFELSSVLESRGVKVIPFAMKSDRNFPTPYEEYFVDNIDFNTDSNWRKFRESAKIVKRIIYSTHAQKALSRLIEHERPDIAHLHMIDHQISPSILPVLKRYKIPVMQTVHQYKLVCPNYRLYIDHKEEICERCIKGAFINALLQRCHKRSFAASALVAVESYVHRWLKLYRNHIDLFHVPSRFIGSKLIEGGFEDKKVKHLFYAINLDDYSFEKSHDDYFLYFGRLSPEKGILTLLKAFERISGSGARLRIAGEGPQKEELEQVVRSRRMTGVRFLGLLSGEELKKCVARAQFVVVPSLWYDNSPLVIYEAFALGTPVIGTRLGGIPELVEEGVTGSLFHAGNHVELAEKIVRLLKNPGLLRDMGANARAMAENEFCAWKHAERMMTLYNSIKP